jgi:hypothetical protein
MAAAHQVNITDRAKRYRAQNNVTGPRKCVLCGSRADLGVMHLTGNESHGETANLAYGCRSCNGKLAAAYKAVGAGKPTNQYNPSSGVPTFEQYMWAVSNHSRGAHDSGGAVIHATPKHKRIEYARRIVSKSQQTKRDRLDDRWNPPTRQNLFGFGKGKDARRTTPAHGGIAFHQGRMKSRKSPDDRNAEFLRSQLKPKVKKSAGASAMPDEATLQAGFKRGLSLSDMLRANPAAWFPTATYAQGLVDRLSVEGIKARIVESKSKQGGYEVVWKGKRKGKRNPASASAEVFEDFHGFGPTEVVTVSKEIHHHAHLASLGELVQLDVWGVDGKGHKVTGFKGALLACNESRDQLFVEGGDQTMNLADFGIRKPHETETLGRVTNIGYQTNKTHLGDEGGEAVYVHRFRATNQNGKHVVVKMTREPDLIYDVRNEQLLFSGGSYEILREGINK